MIVHPLTDLWAWQLLGERGYEGNPLRAYEPIHASTPFSDAHYDRWLDLFVSTIDAAAVARWPTTMTGDDSSRADNGEICQPSRRARRPPRSSAR